MRKKLILPLLFFAIKPLSAITILTLWLDSNITFDLSLSPNFPPNIYPYYYFPTSTTSVNPEGIRINVGIFTFWGSTITYAFLDIRGLGNFSSTISLNQLYWTIASAPLPSPSTPPPPPWNSLSTYWQQVDVIEAPTGLFSRVNVNYDMDFCFQLQADDEPTPPSGVHTVVYIRFYGL